MTEEKSCANMLGTGRSLLIWAASQFGHRFCRNKSDSTEKLSLWRLLPPLKNCWLRNRRRDGNFCWQRWRPVSRWSSPWIVGSWIYQLEIATGIGRRSWFWISHFGSKQSSIRTIRAEELILIVNLMVRVVIIVEVVIDQYCSILLNGKETNNRSFLNRHPNWNHAFRCSEFPSTRQKLTECQPSKEA